MTFPFRLPLTRATMPFENRSHKTTVGLSVKNFQQTASLIPAEKEPAARMRAEMAPGTSFLQHPEHQHITKIHKKKAQPFNSESRSTDDALPPQQAIGASVFRRKTGKGKVSTACHRPSVTFQRSIRSTTRNHPLIFNRLLIIVPSIIQCTSKDYPLDKNRCFYFKSVFL